MLTTDAMSDSGTDAHHNSIFPELCQTVTVANVIGLLQGSNAVPGRASSAKASFPARSAANGPCRLAIMPQENALKDPSAISGSPR